ncbi:hypothetical protein PAPYR_8551 [Paratrimastix pyriformis]|uniref:Protein Abitram n=1 Tax=Paratrimastix pyriformis TaxID=342808 RepID=A0ABQ8UCT8_9EUKA|nr:hypothetical protein PAPYR_8551 [Paratrimastix pyriformis]
MITTSDGMGYKVVSGCRGSLLEVNHRLQEDPTLLTRKPETEGFIAIINPRDVAQDYAALTLAQYEARCADRVARGVPVPPGIDMNLRQEKQLAAREGRLPESRAVAQTPTCGFFWNTMWVDFFLTVVSLVFWQNISPVNHRMASVEIGFIEDRPPVVFVVTGFGPFCGLTNPTQAIIEALPQSLPLNQLRDILSLSVFEVAAAPVTNSLLFIHKELGFPSPRTPFSALPTSEVEACPCFLYHQVLNEPDLRNAHVVFLHLGLHAGLKDCFRLETRAYNTAFFGPMGDVRGFRMNNAPILSGRTVGVPYASPLCTHARPGDSFSLLASVANDLNDRGYRVEISDDPGRYLCNFLYETSLFLAEHANQHSLCLSEKAHKVSGIPHSHSIPCMTRRSWSIGERPDQERDQEVQENDSLNQQDASDALLSTTPGSLSFESTIADSHPLSGSFFETLKRTKNTLNFITSPSRKKLKLSCMLITDSLRHLVEPNPRPSSTGVSRPAPTLTPDSRPRTVSLTPYTRPKTTHLQRPRDPSVFVTPRSPRPPAGKSKSAALIALLTATPHSKVPLEATKDILRTVERRIHSPHPRLAESQLAPPRPIDNPQVSGSRRQRGQLPYCHVPACSPPVGLAMDDPAPAGDSSLALGAAPATAQSRVGLHAPKRSSSLREVAGPVVESARGAPDGTLPQLRRAASRAESSLSALAEAALSTPRPEPPEGAFSTPILSDLDPSFPPLLPIPIPIHGPISAWTAMPKTGPSVSELLKARIKSFDCARRRVHEPTHPRPSSGLPADLVDGPLPPADRPTPADEDLPAPFGSGPAAPSPAAAAATDAPMPTPVDEGELPPAPDADGSPETTVGAPAPPHFLSLGSGEPGHRVHAPPFLGFGALLGGGQPPGAAIEDLGTASPQAPPSGGKIPLDAWLWRDPSFLRQQQPAATHDGTQGRATSATRPSSQRSRRSARASGATSQGSFSARRASQSKTSTSTPLPSPATPLSDDMGGALDLTPNPPDFAKRQGEKTCFSLLTVWLGNPMRDPEQDVAHLTSFIASLLVSGAGDGAPRRMQFASSTSFAEAAGGRASLGASGASTSEAAAVGLAEPRDPSLSEPPAPSGPPRPKAPFASLGGDLRSRGSPPCPTARSSLSSSLEGLAPFKRVPCPEKRLSLAGKQVKALIHLTLLSPRSPQPNPLSSLAGLTSAARTTSARPPSARPRPPGAPDEAPGPTVAGSPAAPQPPAPTSGRGHTRSSLEAGAATEEQPACDEHCKEFYYLHTQACPPPPTPAPQIKVAYPQAQHELGRWLFDVSVRDVTAGLSAGPGSPGRAAAGAAGPDEALSCVFAGLKVNPDCYLIFHPPDQIVFSASEDLPWVHSPIDLYRHKLTIEVSGISPHSKRRVKIVATEVLFGDPPAAPEQPEPSRVAAAQAQTQPTPLVEPPPAVEAGADGGSAGVHSLGATLTALTRIPLSPRTTLIDRSHLSLPLCTVCRIRIPRSNSVGAAFRERPLTTILRTKYDFPGNPVADCLSIFCCSPCAVTQQSRELIAQGSPHLFTSL